MIRPAFTIPQSRIRAPAPFTQGSLRWRYRREVIGVGNVCASLAGPRAAGAVPPPYADVAAYNAPHGYDTGGGRTLFAPTAASMAALFYYSVRLRCLDRAPEPRGPPYGWTKCALRAFLAPGTLFYYSGRLRCLDRAPAARGKLTLPDAVAPNARRSPARRAARRKMLHICAGCGTI